MELKVRTRQPYKRTAFISLFVLAAIILVGLFFWWQRPLASPFSTRILSNAKVDLYYPAHVPSGYQIDYNSVQQPQTGVTTLAIRGKGHTIYVGQQAVPADFDMAMFTKNFQEPQHITTAAGAGIVGMLTSQQQKARVASVVGKGNDATWIIINASTQVSADILRDIAENLVKSN